MSLFMSNYGWTLKIDKKAILVIENLQHLQIMYIVLRQRLWTA